MASTLTHRPPVDPTVRPRGGVQVWAAVGAVLLVLELTAIVRWVTGPSFEPVPVGEDRPPEWMRVVLDTGQIVAALVALVIVWVLLLRPLVRERRLTLNGTFVIAGFLASFWDGLSAAPQHWFNYNSYLYNQGSVISEVPGVLSPNSPGVGQAWPFFGMAAYIILIPGLGALGAAVMRRARRAFPTLRAPGLIGICILFMMAVEMFLEAIFLMPLGFYHLGGGQWPVLNGDKFSSMPFIEVLHGAFFFTLPGVLKFFVNDNGETIAERGSQAIRGTLRQSATRAVAVIGVLHLGFLLVYHLPVMAYAANSREYPDDVKQRSYFLGNACGERLDIACPGPDIPILRPGAGHFDWNGNYVPPER